MAQDIDLSQFHSIFFEECSEGIEAMESGLLKLEDGQSDTETINTIFFALHTLLKVVQEPSGLTILQNLPMVWKPCWMRCAKVGDPSQ